MTCEVKMIGCSSSSGGSDLTIKDEGVTVDTAVESIDFVGDLVTATETSDHNVQVKVIVREVTSDPSSPIDGDMWLLKTGGSGGLAFSIPTLGLTLGSGGGGATYELRVKTVSDGIVGTALT